MGVIEVTNPALGDVDQPGNVTYRSAGVPTTQFNAIAAKGAICVDTTNGKAYINTGTKASNTWTVVGAQT